MILFTALVLAALQAQTPAQQQAAAQLPPSPIAKLVVTPAKPAMIAQDTLRLTAQALDASGKPVDNVRFRYIGSSGARFEGTRRHDRPRPLRLDRHHPRHRRRAGARARGR